MRTLIRLCGLFAVGAMLLAPGVLLLRAQDAPTNGLVAYYPFDGNPDDAVGTNHGTVVGAVLAIDRFNRPNRAYSLDGVNDYVSFESSPLDQMTNWTISAWMLPSVLPQMGIVVCLGYDDGTPGTANGVSFGAASASGESGTEFAAALAGIVWVPSGYSFSSTNVWHHLAITRGSGVTRFYVNGARTPNASLIEPRNPTAFRIGAANCESPARFFKGAIDDVRIYCAALSSDEVAQLYGAEARAMLNVRKAIYLDSNNLWPGGNYQIQASTDLTTWTNVGAPFVATNSYWRTRDYWDVDNWSGLFFRLQFAP